MPRKRSIITLSTQEAKVLVALAQGVKPAGIAKIHKVHEKTVSTYIYRLYAKFGVTTKQSHVALVGEALRKAYRKNLQRKFRSETTGLIKYAQIPYGSIKYSREKNAYFLAVLAGEKKLIPCIND